jgi:hypothetical protein
MRVQEKYRDFWKIQELREKLARKRSTPAYAKPASAGRSFEERFALGAFYSRQEKRSSEWEMIVQRFLAGRPAVKLYVKEEGWYRVSQTELAAAGLNARVNPRYLQLYVEGQEQAIRVIGEKDGRFDPQDSIEFYGAGLDTLSTDTRVYWLIVGGRPGKRIDEYRGRGGSLGSLSSLSFPYTVEKKEQMNYFPNLKNGEEDNFFGPIVSAVRVDQLLSVQHPDPSPPGDAKLEVSLQGATNVPHRVKVFLNETTEVGKAVFDGQSQALLSVEVSQSLLLEGDNLVSLIAEGGPMDFSLLDTIRLTYWHTYRADGNALKFTAQGGRQVFIDGFSKPKIRVFDITDPGAVLEVEGVVKPQGSGYATTFITPGREERTLIALTGEKVKSPESIVFNQPSSWHQSRGGYDVVMISHGDFLESLQPLKSLREAQGLKVTLIDVEDLYDEFSFGHKSPQALKDFLSLAKSKWRRPPRFVLLVGDGSFDPRNYLGYGDSDFVPTKLVETVYLETASDDWFVDFNGDGLPEMAVGRLPVQTVEEAATVVSKIVGYDRSGGMRGVLLVADRVDPGDFDFEAASRGVGALLPSGLGAKEIFRGHYVSDEDAKAELMRSFDQGALLVNYIGHGGMMEWRGDLLTDDDAEGLNNGLRLPLVVSMTCLNGFFQAPYADSMAEALLKAANGGAIAVWASSGLTEPHGQVVMNKELVRLLFNGAPLTLGEATEKAKAAMGDQDVRKTWILFGDPATRLKP